VNKKEAKPRKNYQRSRHPAYSLLRESITTNP